MYQRTEYIYVFLKILYFNYSVIFLQKRSFRFHMVLVNFFTQIFSLASNYVGMCFVCTYIQGVLKMAHNIYVT
jgi:hypothetical protein